MIENNKEVLEQRMQKLEQELVDLALEDAMKQASVSDYSFQMNYMIYSLPILKMDKQSMSSSMTSLGVVVHQVS